MIFSYLRKSVPFWDFLICIGRESQGGGRVIFLLPNDQAHVMDFHLLVLEQVLLPAFQGSWSLHRLHPARLPSSAIRVAPQMAMHYVQVNFYVIVRLNVNRVDATGKLTFGSPWGPLLTAFCWAQEDTWLHGVLPASAVWGATCG